MYSLSTTITPIQEEKELAVSGQPHVQRPPRPPSKVPSLGLRNSFLRRHDQRTTSRRSHHEKASSVRSSFCVRETTGEGLYWTRLSVNLSKGGTVRKRILQEAWGEARPFETTAIMGASGCGKTTLLSALSGRIGSKVDVTGEIRYCNTLVDANTNMAIYKKKLAFVAQDDVLNEASTPREAIYFSARLRLPRNTSHQTIEALVSDYVTNLGLDACADSEIGGILKKGISGGERKRTSVGIELVTDPSIILLDEPTSGLDSFAAKNLMSLLDKMAKAGNAVLFTIHQPSSRIFFRFDQLILLDRGRLMYMGKTSKMLSDFEVKGFPLEATWSPADWALEVAQENAVEQLEYHGFFPRDERVLPPPESKPLEETKCGISIFAQTTTVTKRQCLNFLRLPLVLQIGGIVVAVVLGLCAGILFWDIGSESQQDLSVLIAQTGAFTCSLLSSMLIQSTTLILITALERPLFLKEYMTDHYTVIPYVLSHYAIEMLQTVVILVFHSLICFFMISFQMRFIVFYVLNFLVSLNATASAALLGAPVSDPVLASSLLPLILIPQFCFAGVLVPVPLIPSWIRWVQYVIALRWAMALALVYEYDECSDDDKSYCDAALEANGLDPDDRWWYWIMLVGLFVLFKTSSIFLLHWIVVKYRR